MLLTRSVHLPPVPPAAKTGRRTADVSWRRARRHECGLSQTTVSGHRYCREWSAVRRRCLSLLPVAALICGASRRDLLFTSDTRPNRRGHVTALCGVGAVSIYGLKSSVSVAVAPPADTHGAAQTKRGQGRRRAR